MLLEVNMLTSSQHLKGISVNADATTLPVGNVETQQVNEAPRPDEEIVGPTDMSTLPIGKDESLQPLAEAYKFDAWTQNDIIKETEKYHQGSGFFNLLADITDWVFGDAISYDVVGRYIFPADNLTVGQIRETLFAFKIRWQKGSGGLPDMYIEVDDELMAEVLMAKFDIEPILTPDSSEDEQLKFFVYGSL